MENDCLFWSIVFSFILPFAFLRVFFGFTFQRVGRSFVFKVLDWDLELTVELSSISNVAVTLGKLQRSQFRMYFIKVLLGLKLGTCLSTLLNYVSVPWFSVCEMWITVILFV